MKAISLINNIFNFYKEFDPPANGNMGVDTSALGLTGDSPDADPDTPRRSRMRVKRGGAVLTPDRNGVFESETRKRKRGSNSRTPQKRPRIEGTRNSIHFNAVYQNRRAAKKHTIIRIPEDPVRPVKFYILRCEDHDIHFDDSPLQAGLAHLSEKHQHQNPSFETIVEHFGYEVIEVKEERDSIHVRTDSPSPERPRKNTSHAVKKSRSRRSRRKTQNSIDPHDLVPGDVYIIYWSASKQWYAGLYIPLQDPESIGIDESLEAMGLLSDIPPCYEYDSSSKSFSWAEGYEDGGPDASEQQFPFMFFEGLDFPDLSHVVWIPIGEIQRWNEDKALMIEHSDQVFEYLKQRQAAEQPNRFGPDEVIPDSADDNSTLDLAPRSLVADSSTDFRPAQNAETVTPNTAPEADASDQAEDADVTGQTKETQKGAELEPEEVQEDTELVPEEVQNDTHPEPQEVQKVIQMGVEEAQDTELEPEKAAQPPDTVEDEDIVMSSQENSTESAAQQPTEGSEDVVMETPEDATQEPVQQSDSQSDGDDHEIILNTQEDPAENVSSPKQPEEVSTEREEESWPHEAREERLSSADLENLLLEGEDLELHFPQSEQRELNQVPTPTPALETISLSRAANDVVNAKQEESSSTSPALERTDFAQAENNSGDETGRIVSLSALLSPQNLLAMKFHSHAFLTPIWVELLPYPTCFETGSIRDTESQRARCAVANVIAITVTCYISSAHNVAANDNTVHIDSAANIDVFTATNDVAASNNFSAISTTITNTATPVYRVTAPAIRSITIFGSSASTRTISANGNFTIATIITASNNQVSDIIPPPFIISTIDFGAPAPCPNSA
ncbi:hypothetical protein RAB80_010180 [Fusarium oxysporum f. sp. vasinfectum]|nr:hypothetical protein RAB80_010180 [Fusarium oxysporum f. sp. vasinfectum]